MQREQIDTSPNATSQLYYVIGGRGFSAVNGRPARWEKGDFLTLPANSRATFYADSGSDAAMYWVHDEPLLRHLGAEATEPRFRPTKFRRNDAVARLDEIALAPGCKRQEQSKRPVGQCPAGTDTDDYARVVGNVWSAAAG